MYALLLTNFWTRGALDKVTSELSEWFCFKSMISRWRWGPVPLHRYIKPETLADDIKAESRRLDCEEKAAFEAKLAIGV
jgi:hypothetical protein